MRILLLTLFLTLGLPVHGEDGPLTYDRISLSVSAEREIGNDTLVVVLQAQAEGEDTARLAGEVNDRIRWAVDKAKAVDGVAVETVDYQTYPVYRQQKLMGWRVSHSVRLESRDGAALSELLGGLQERLNLVSLSYHVSPAAQRSTEEALIGEALTLFQDRARRITTQMQRPDFRIVHMDISTAGGGRPPQMMRAMAMESARPSSAPVLETGKQLIQVNVNGTIEMRLP